MSTAAADVRTQAQDGPWNPGVVSPVPVALRPRATAVAPDHVHTPYTDALELADLTGLPVSDLVAFRPGRLVLHELLVRVTADFSVPDGPRIEDLGINMREIARALLARHLEPRMPAFVAEYEALRGRIGAIVDAELARLQAREVAPAPAPRRGLFGWLRGSGSDAIAASPLPVDETQLPAQWQARARRCDDEVERAALTALAKVAGALLVRHGRMWGDRTMLARLVTGMACNDAASAHIGRAMEPLLRDAAAQEGYRLLPAQSVPVVMNTKGPSAAGKSTIRPLQRELAGRIGVSWADFALMSPDIFRKQLLDYRSLGPDYKYGASLTGDELALIDHKLDRYMARKAARGDMPHLLIDRFRFDAFAPDSDEAGSNLLTRFGERIYLFFLITPPASLVDRAWNRGLEVGRYKSVDDVLAHGVEAYAGFTELLFTWVARADKRVHFEFLDNAVPQGERPRTAAFGWNDALHILDVARLLDIERFQHMNVDANAPRQLFPAPALLDAARNLGLLARCFAHFARVTFAEPSTGAIWLELAGGRVRWRDPALLEHALSDADARAVIEVLVPDALHGAGEPRSGCHVGADERVHTVGRWGEAMATPAASAATGAP